MNSKTPRTDAAVKCRDTSGQNSSKYRYVYEVSADLARELEEENNSMRDIIKEAHDALKIEIDAYCSAAPNYLKETLSKLQSFLK